MNHDERLLANVRLTPDGVVERRRAEDVDRACPRSVSLTPARRAPGYGGLRLSSSCPAKWQATKCSGSSSRHSGTSLLHRSSAKRQRVWETAAGGHGGRVRDLALQLLGSEILVLGDVRNRRQERPGIGMQGILEHPPRGRQLDDLSDVHDRDPVRDMGNDREVVGDEEVGQTQLLLQVGQEIQHVGLDRTRRALTPPRRRPRTRDDRPEPERCRCAGAGHRKTRAGIAAGAQR